MAAARWGREQLFAVETIPAAGRPFYTPRSDEAAMIIRPIFTSLAAAFAASVILSTTTGCGVISAIGNPKAAWALQEPAPMAVILRRADVARATATNIDRLLSSTGVDVSSKWVLKLALKKADVEAALKEMGADPDYVVPKGAKIRVVQAEAWAKILSDLCPHETKFPSLLAQVSPDVGTAYAEISGQAKAVAKLKSDKAAEETAARRRRHLRLRQGRGPREEEAGARRAQIDKLTAEYRPKVDAFMIKLKDDAAKASPEAKKQLPLALVAFRRAIDDAKISNSVALVRYPLAMPGMPQELKTQAKRIVADVIEDKTGHRPNLDKFDPDIKLEGGGVKLTLNGLPPDALASLKPEAIIVEVTTRAKDYAVRVLTLTPNVAETQELLDLEADVVKNTMDGLSVEEGKVPEAGDDLSELKVDLDEAAAIASANSSKGAVMAKGGKSARHPVPLTSACDEGKPKVEEGTRATRARATRARPPPRAEPRPRPRRRPDPRRGARRRSRSRSRRRRSRSSSTEAKGYSRAGCRSRKKPRSLARAPSSSSGGSRSTAPGSAASPARRGATSRTPTGAGCPATCRSGSPSTAAWCRRWWPRSRRSSGLRGTTRPSGRR